MSTEISSKLGCREIDTLHQWSRFNELFPTKTLLQIATFISNQKPIRCGKQASVRQSPQADVLTSEQKLVFDFINQRTNAVSFEQFYLIVHGAGGCGKSFVLDAVISCLNQRGIKCLVCAPTGVASFTIGGMTIHSALGLSYKQNFYTLDEELISDTVLDRFVDVKILFLDEYSMIGAKFLAVISKRLKKITGNEADFGGISVVLIGHIFQLNPVYDKELWLDPLKVKDKNDTLLMEGLNLYRRFKNVIKLSTNVRHKADSEFQLLLNRIQTKKVNQADVDLLSSRRMNQLDADEQTRFAKAIHLFATRKEVLEHNKKRIHQLGVPVIGIEREEEDVFDDEYEEPMKVYVGPSVKVMLRKNLWTSAGLTNGAVGIVHKVVFHKEESGPEFILVHFPGYTGPTLIDDCIPIFKHCVQKFDRRLGRKINKREFPLLNSYATTIHKSQSCTLEKAVVKLGSREWFYGMTYTALSRVKTLQDLVLLDDSITLRRFKGPDFYIGSVDREKEEKRMDDLLVTH